MTSALAPDPVATMTGFARALRRAGVAADRARLTASLGALALLDPLDLDQVYWAARLSLCAEPEDLPRFDEVFDVWFRDGERARPVGSAPDRAGTRPVVATVTADEAAPDGDLLPVAASDAEVLRHRDIATLTAAERAEIHRLIAVLRPRVATRRTARRRPGGHERIDVHRTVRRMLRNGGEPSAPRYERRSRKARRLVLLLDVSGSMAPYAEALLRFAHAASRVAPSTTEVFTISTHLTRITRPMRLRDPDAALQEAGTTVADWSGGTRLGEALRSFLDRWGQRGTARRAVVVVASDGWERGDAALLGEQMARLSRLAHRVVWINPHAGKDGFAPAAAGMSAALPYVDDLVAGHTFAALRDVAQVIARA